MNKKPALHIAGMPHTQWTEDYVSCAYTMKAKKLAQMMSSIGYLVHVYGSEDWDFDVTGDKVCCITKEKQQEFFGNNDHKKTFYNITWGPEEEHWQHFNKNAIKEIKKRINPRDIIGTFSGVCQKQIADAFPDNQTVELGIGYTGVFSKYLVFESYAWQNYVGGLQRRDNGEFYETVIPNYWDTEEFPFSEERGDYYLYIGRLIDRKGYRIAQEVCERLGKKLILAGQTDSKFEGYGTYIGTVNAEQRGELMSKAIAGFVPTLYRPPLEGTHCEFQLCGTPVITTPFGVFNETVIDGFNGKRCYDFKEFVKAAEWATTVSSTERKEIQKHAQEKWSMDVLKYEYDKYFQRLMNVYDLGWYHS